MLQISILHHSGKLRLETGSGGKAYMKHLDKAARVQAARNRFFCSRNHCT